FMLKKFTLCVSTMFFVSAIFAPGAEIAQDKNALKGFVFNNPENFKEFTNFHGGAGTIKYNEYWGPDDYDVQHQFFRVVMIPPKCSIGEYRLVDSDEVMVLLSGYAFVTVKGRTGALVEDTLVPIQMGETIGIYNPTNEDVSLVWVATVTEKGKYNPVDLNNDLTKQRPEGVIPFPHIYLNYWIFEPSENPSHKGLGSLVETLGTVDFNYFKTGLHSRFFIVPQGASIGYHTHYTNEEHFFIVKGTGRGTVNDVTMTLNPLDCIKCGIDDSHGIYNNGNEDVVIFFTNLPLPGVKNWGRVEDLGDNLSNR
ncbi:cupin domain-containing protein, partial [Candidatus Latescibacterota bacterium]